MATTLTDALRLVKPGEMVVSLTDILDKLGNKITADERNQLLIAMLSPRREKVQPGDLITTDMVNQILADTSDLQVRVAELEQGAPVGEKPAFGTIDVSYTGGTPSAVIGKAHPHIFSIRNDTDTALRIKAAAKISAPNGDWAGASLFENGASSVFVNVPSQKELAITVQVTAPASAVLNDIATLTVEVDAGLPHNKHGATSAELKVALTDAPPVTHTLEMGQPVFPVDFKTPPPPVGVDGQIPKTKERSIIYPFKHDTLNSAEDPGFEFIVILSEPDPLDVATLTKWSATISGTPPDKDENDPTAKTRTLRKSITLEPGTLRNVSLKLIAPNENTRLKCSVLVRSTNLPTEIQKAAIPVVIQSQ